MGNIPISYERNTGIAEAVTSTFLDASASLPYMTANKRFTLLFCHQPGIDRSPTNIVTDTVTFDR